MLSLRHLIALAVWIGFPFVAKAECVDYGSFAHWSGGVTTPGTAEDVVVAGGYAYVADGPAGLTIVDVSDPQSPEVVSTIGTGEDAVGVTVIGDWAYVAASEFGLATVNVAEPTTPFITDFAPVTFIATAVGSNGSMVYVASKRHLVDGRLTVFDTSVLPQKPERRGEVWTPREPIQVIVRGSLVHVPDTICFEKGCFGGIGTYDVSNPDNPMEIGYVSTSVLTGADFRGDMGYACTPDFGIWVLDASDPTDIQRIVNIPELIANDAWIVRDRVFLATEGIQIADLSTLAMGYDVVDIPTPPRGNANRVIVHEDRAYVVDNGGLQIARVESYDTLPMIGEFDTPGRALGIFVEGDVAFVADETDGLQIIDISDPELPTLIRSVDTEEFAVDVDVVGDHAYLAASAGGVVVVDISDLVTAEVVGDRRSVGIADALAVRWPYVFLAERGTFEQQGIRVFDVSNPAVPVRVAGLGLPDDARDIVIDGSVAYVALEADGVARIDISDPLAPSLIDIIPLGGGSARALAFFPGPSLTTTIGVVGEDLGLKVIDAARPAGEAVVSSMTLPGNGLSIGPAGDVLVIGTDSKQAISVSLSNPTEPRLIGGTTTLGIAQATMGKKYMFVAQDEAGLAIYPTPCDRVTVDVPTDVTPPVTLHANVPNPFRPTTRFPFDLAEATTVTLRIFDASGRLVNTLLDREPVGPGAYAPLWDGQTETGAAAPSGVYFYTLDAGSVSLRGKAVRLP